MIFRWDDDDIHFVLDQHVNWIVLVPDYWSDPQQIDMSLRSDTFSWFRNIKSLLIFLNTTCLAKEQHIPLLFCFVLAHVMLWRSILPLHRRETLNSKAAKQKAGLQKNKKSKRDCGVGLPQWNPQFNIRPMTFLHPDEDNVCRLLFVVIYLYI